MIERATVFKNQEIQLLHILFEKLFVFDTFNAFFFSAVTSFKDYHQIGSFLRIIVPINIVFLVDAV